MSCITTADNQKTLLYFMVSRGKTRSVRGRHLNISIPSVPATPMCYITRLYIHIIKLYCSQSNILFSILYVPSCSISCLTDTYMKEINFSFHFIKLN